MTSVNDLDTNSVGLVSLMDMERLGEITLSTMNYYEYLGTPANQKIIGANVNNFLPSSFRHKHGLIMRSQEYTDFLVLQERKFFLERFDGSLTRAVGTVKIVPDLRSNVQAC